MKKVLVTGASGFIGRHLFPFLKERDYEIFPCYNQNSLDLPSYTHPIQVDILNQDERRCLLRELKPSHLIHTAWYVNPKDYLHSIQNIDWMNASIDLYKEFAQNGGKRCVSVGTCAEYNWSEGFLKEDVTSLQDDTLYAYAKIATHAGLKKLSQVLNFEMMWGRVFWLYGPGESSQRFIPNLINTLLREEAFVCKDPNKEIDLMHVKDVAFALACALESKDTGAFNIASGESVSIEMIVKKTASILNCPHLIKFESNNNKQPKIRASTDKLLSLPHFQRQYDHDKGLNSYIDFLK
ncbi:MAG: NAD-dependent epimerase/dehydratase [Proteobacteria bacterium]|nr:NAD-dependent epimerase/dehydratase [Pseudomonadota bacterium]